jgi:muramoyltetrapeptide carboxypeptidase LdcA involved in peptidoglycan recycling
MDLINTQIDQLSKRALESLKLEKGEVFQQNSSEKYQAQFINFDDDIEATYNLTELTKWKSLDNSIYVDISGRIIGGCLDTLGNLVGTPYGNIEYFKNTFQDDGLIIYLENCALSPCGMTRTLHQMRLAKWFDGISGVIFGRTTAKEVTDTNSLNYVEALENCFKDLNIAVIYDADIGHKPPNMTLINGALAELSMNNGKATLTQTLI